MDDYNSKPTTTGFVPLGGSTNGSIETVSDGDWLRVELIAGTAYQIDIFGTGSTALADPRAQLRTAERVTLASDDNSGDGTAARLFYTPTQTASYFVQVSESGRDATGDYTVALKATDGQPQNPTTPPSGDVGTDLSLTEDVTDRGDFGNKFNAATDADGLITASFQNTGGDARLSVTGFDIDFTNEVEVRLNGKSLGFLKVGANNGLNAGDSFVLAAGDQIAGTNTITFEQKLNVGYKWGVTDLLIQDAGSAPPTSDPEPTGSDITLTEGAIENGDFGNKFNNQTDADGVITASFENTGSDAILSLTGFDVDFSNEVEVKLNGVRLGFLSTGPNNGLNNGDSFAIAAGDQKSGTNVISFEQNISNSYKWGVTDILLRDADGAPPITPDPEPTDSDIALTFGATETDRFGNKFDGTVDSDGVITAKFENTGVDTTLSLLGFDVDFANEIEVRLNGDRLGFLSKGSNNELNNGDSFLIDANDQLTGTNTITFEQTISDTYKWGITNILLEEATGSPPPDKPPASGTGDGVLDVMIIGDSFSIPGRGLPGKLEAALESRGYGETEIIDLTQSGRNIYGARDAVLDHFDSANATIPEVAVLAIGINDALKLREVSEIDRVLTRTIDELQGEGVEVLLAVPEPFFPLKSGEQGYTDPAEQAAFRAIYDELASENGLIIARDFIEGLTDDADLLQGDVFHPNPAGVDRILENILPELEQVIDRALPDAGGATSASVQIEDIVASDGGTS